MTALDALLLLMVVIWGANFSLVKVALRDFPELAFNAFRLAIAASIFLVAIWRSRRASRLAGAAARRTPDLSRADWIRLACLGLIGHFAYQLCFLGGVKRTSVANGSLILGTSPILIALLSSLAGHERVSRSQWLGVILSLAGLYLVVGHDVTWSMESRLGDLLMLGSTLCWALYSVGAQPLLRVHSPLVVTGLSMTVGAACYVLVTLPELTRVDWSPISTTSWLLMIVSASLALGFAYLIWYTAVQRQGSARTSVYSYLTPLVAMVVAAVWLDEPISPNQSVGAGTILAGLAVTRWSRTTDVRQSFDDHSTTVPRAFDDPSASARESFDEGLTPLE